MYSHVSFTCFGEAECVNGRVGHCRKRPMWSVTDHVGLPWVLVLVTWSFTPPLQILCGLPFPPKKWSLTDYAKFKVVLCRKKGDGSRFNFLKTIVVRNGPLSSC